jgi:hypothetical protein
VSPELREELESARCAQIQLQIRALIAQVEQIGPPLSRWERERVAKLTNKILTLERKLAQPMLLAM